MDGRRPVVVLDLRFRYDMGYLASGKQWNSELTPQSRPQNATQIRAGNRDRGQRQLGIMKSPDPHRLLFGRA